MRFRHIEIFHAVYANGSISGAARALQLSQPSVSKMLRHAEDQLGIRLFNLVRGRLVPTDEAHALYREVGDLFERMNSLQQTAKNLRSAGGGHIRLAVVPSLGLSVTPHAVTRFRTREPNVTFEIQTLHHDDLVRALHERECDLAIAYDPPAHPRLKRVEIASGELALLFRKGALDEGRERLPLNILDGKELIGLTASGPIGELFTAATERHDVSFRETVSVQTFYIAAALAQLGAGLTVVDEFTARARLSSDLDFRFFDPPLCFSVCCVFLEDRPLSKVAKRFVERLRQSLTEAQGSAWSIDKGYDL